MRTCPQCGAEEQEIACTRCLDPVATTAPVSPALELLLARHDMTENLFRRMEEELPCEPMDDAMLARMNQSLGFSGAHAKDRDYRPYCVRQHCEYMPRMFRVAEGFRCWSCNNVWDLRAAVEVHAAAG